jgi:hypothetical protein
MARLVLARYGWFRCSKAGGVWCRKVGYETVGWGR